MNGKNSGPHYTGKYRDGKVYFSVGEGSNFFCRNFFVTKSMNCMHEFDFTFLQ